MTLRILLFWLLLCPGVAVAEIGVETNTPFGPLSQNRLDLYWPETVTDDTPVLIFFYGGGWTRGDKSQLEAIGRRFAEAGVIFVAPNYRLYPDVSFPGFVEDSAMATAWAWRNLRQSDDTPRRLFVGGWSAGGYNAAMIALNQHYLGALDIPDGAVAGLIGLAGPYSGGLCAGSRCPHVFPEETRAAWTLPDFVDPTDPPMLLVTAGQDRFVPTTHRDTLGSAAESVGVAVQTLNIDEADHQQLLMHLRLSESELRAAVLDFIGVP